MSLHTDLLKQATILATREPRRPLQASLRRAASAAYYALFHLLVEEGTRLMLSGTKRKPLRDCLARAFHHGKMKTVSKQFYSGGISKKLSSGFEPEPLQSQLRIVARTFCDLQEARHDADYNRAKRFTRAETLDLIKRADDAVRKWKQVRRTLQADTYLIGLLAFELMQG